MDDKISESTRAPSLPGEAGKGRLARLASVLESRFALTTAHDEDCDRDWDRPSPDRNHHHGDVKCQ